VRLHGIVAPIVGVVNRNLTVTIRPSVGYTSLPGGRRVAAYGEPYSLRGQVQSLTYTDIIVLDRLQITGIRRAIYLSGSIEGIVRVNQQGGDLVELPDGSIWLVVYVLENYALTSGWVKVAVTMQNE